MIQITVKDMITTDQNEAKRTPKGILKSFSLKSVKQTILAARRMPIIFFLADNSFTSSIKPVRAMIHPAPTTGKV